MEFQIFSKALYSTWILYRPERILFDVGEGISTILGNSVYAIKDIFLTHGHVDHISGLWGLINTRNTAMGDRNKQLRIN
ncbi:MBL fold metallo-hydrolase, partial [Mesotoga sp. HF07.pep.5.2.highcov]